MSIGTAWAKHVGSLTAIYVQLAALSSARYAYGGVLYCTYMYGSPMCTTDVQVSYYR